MEKGELDKVITTSGEFQIMSLLGKEGGNTFAICKQWLVLCRGIFYI